MRSLVQEISGRLTHKIGDGRRSGRWLLALGFDEWKRALAAEQRYHDLKQTDVTALARDGASRGDIPRMVFNEFYSPTDSNRS